MRRVLPLLACLAAGGLPPPGAAQPVTRQQEVCTELVQRRGGSVGTQTNPCWVLAGLIVIQRSTGLYLAAATSSIPQRELQPLSTGAANATGSAAQSGAAPSAQPLAVAGGSIAAVGSNAGADAITAVALNPLVVFGSPGASPALARALRITDVTVFLPVKELDRDEDGDIDYFGSRIRLNLTGPGAGSEVWRRARDAFEDLLAAETDLSVQLGDQLSTVAPDRIEGCVDSLEDADAAAAQVREACGVELEFQLSQANYERFHARMRDVRREADARYLGLDLRLEVGDPTLGEVENADATAITAAFAFGQQFPRQDALAPSMGVRGSAGIRYAALHDMDETSFAVDGGVALVVERPIDAFQNVDLSAGLDFRFGDAADELEAAFQSDFLTFRAALTVPVTEIAGVTVSFGAPLVGDDISKTLSVSGDWKLLLGRALGM